MSKKVKHPKIDRYKVSISQKHELDYVVSRYKKLGFKVTAANIKKAVKDVGASRRKVYLYLNAIATPLINSKKK